MIGRACCAVHAQAWTQHVRKECLFWLSAVMAGVSVAHAVVFVVFVVLVVLVVLVVFVVVVVVFVVVDAVMGCACSMCSHWGDVWVYCLSHYCSNNAIKLN